MTPNETIKAIHYETGKGISVTTEDGIISSIKQIEPHPAFPYIGPGLVDLQVNGHAGIDLNTLPIKTADVIKLTCQLWKEGVTTYLPTIITNDEELIEDALSTIAKACQLDNEINSSIPGIHLEGPFISPEDGARGAHFKKFVCPPKWDLFQKWQNAAEGKIKIITLSPEWPEATKFIELCVESGVKVSIGHTSATPEQIRDAIFAGATMSTHLGNGSHPVLPRHTNYLLEQLSSDELVAGVIADGFHIPEALLKVILRTKGERAILVSDAASLSGMPPGKYTTHIGGNVVLREDGKLHIEGNEEMLAGSAQMLTTGIKHLVTSNLATLSESWNMASKRAASFLDLPSQKGLNTASPADFVLFNWNGQDITINKTYKNGKLQYQK